MKTVIFHDFKGSEGPASHITCIATDDLILVEESLPQKEKEQLILEHGGTLPLAKEA